MSKKLVFPATFSLAAVWFGTHCGGGFATGAQEVAYFVKYGWHAIWIPLISVLLIGWTFKNAWELARLSGTYDYKSYSKVLYAPYEGVFANLFEIAYIILLLMATGAAIAGAGSLINQALNVPYSLGIIIVGFILLLFTVFGSDLVRNAATTMTIFLIAALTFVTLFGIAKGGGNIANVVSTQINFAEVSFGAVLWKACVYAGFQTYLLSAVISVSEPLKTAKDTKMAAIIGIVINAAMLLLVCIMLLGFSPEVLKETLPVYYVVGQLGQPWLYGLYSLILFFALISTGVTLIYAAVKRFENTFDAGLTIRVRRILLSVAFMLCSLGISTFGLKAIVAKGYGSLGYVAIPLIILPNIIVGAIKIKNFKSESKLSEGTTNLKS